MVSRRGVLAALAVGASSSLAGCHTGALVEVQDMSCVRSRTEPDTCNVLVANHWVSGEFRVVVQSESPDGTVHGAIQEEIHLRAGESRELTLDGDLGDGTLFRASVERA
ncbi:uncharacterized protein NP_2184A [Natronomonas pharaonis DSM 2160]|uniref:Secreted glycoprotein n=1 Tax=Natronomonas pharaonis (strain ATCC 35678 / DSM 2160 / CIP 103997 / JCM 8858 / NBRC 14720 / NCIMB 2260 / Gabara) TaxID=348780 RepID=A0A1U7EVV0_NATPD|nr:hypothetical protein [Natronomonas pharaonis]CAI49183.1 uncharacterized protein NP_2184A [Natronomonas pharaonis DSM 2160]